MRIDNKNKRYLVSDSSPPLNPSSSLFLDVCLFFSGIFRHPTCCVTATFSGCCVGSRRGTLWSRTPSAPTPSLSRASTLPPSGQSSSPVVGTAWFNMAHTVGLQCSLNTLTSSPALFMSYDIFKGWESYWVVTQIVEWKWGTVSLIPLFWYRWGGWCLGNRGLCNDTGDKRRAAQASAVFVCTCSCLISLAPITAKDYEIHGTDLAGAVAWHEWQVAHMYPECKTQHVQRLKQKGNVSRVIECISYLSGIWAM